MKTHNERLVYIDAMKGLCMLLVIIDHSGFQLHPMVDFIEVPSFFIVSGMLYRDLPFKTILQKKAFRLIIPYFLFALLFAIPFVIKALSEGTNIANLKTIALFFLLPSNEPLWFLKTLFWIFLLYRLLTLLFNLIHNRVFKTISFIATFIAIAIVGTTDYIKAPLILLTGIPQAIVALPLFAFGNIIAKHNVFEMYRNLNLKRLIIWIFIVTLLWISARSGIMMHVAYYQTHFLSFYFTAIVAFFAISILFFVKEEKLLSWLGRNSLIILGVHVCIIEILQLIGITQQYLLLTLTVLLLIPLVAVFNRFKILK